MPSVLALSKFLFRNSDVFLGVRRGVTGLVGRLEGCGAAEVRVRLQRRTGAR